MFGSLISLRLRTGLAVALVLFPVFGGCASKIEAPDEASTADRLSEGRALWKKWTVTYNVTQPSSRLPAEEVTRILAKVASQWSTSTGIFIKPRPPEDPEADIQIAFSAGLDTFGGERPGVTQCDPPDETGGLRRCTIFLDERTNFLLDGTASPLDLESTLLHQFGHAMGLTHQELSEVAAFSADSPDGTQTDSIPHLGVGTLETLHSLYGRPPSPPPPGSHLAYAVSFGGLAHRVFGVAMNGAIYGSSLRALDTTVMARAQPVTPTNFAPPGAPIIAIGKDGNTANQSQLAVVNKDGVVYVVDNLGQGIPMPGGKIAVPGSRIAGGTLNYFYGRGYNNGPNIFFVDRDGALRRDWLDQEGWLTMALTPPNFAPPGGGVAFGYNYRSNDAFGVVFVADNSGTLQAFRRGVVSTDFQGPFAIASGLKPGSNLASAPQSPEQVNVMYFDASGAFTVVWQYRDNPWASIRPAAIPARAVLAGAALAPLNERSDKLDCIFVGADGSLQVAYVEGIGNWFASSVSPPDTSVPGSPVAAGWWVDPNDKWNPAAIGAGKRSVQAWSPWTPPNLLFQSPR